MNDEVPPTADTPSDDLKTVVVDGVKHAAARASEAIDEGRKPGRLLDVLSKITRQAPLSALFIAFLVGTAVARRRR